MARHAHEFQCTNCNIFNYPMLSDSMDGNYIIVCGGCDHEHYRVIKDGVVTEDRHDHNRGKFNGDRIHVTKAATSKERRQKGLIQAFREMEMAGLAK